MAELRDRPRDGLGNPIVDDWCPYACRMEPGPSHRHSLVLEETQQAYIAWRRG